MLKKILKLIKILPFFFFVGDALASNSWNLIKEKDGIKVFEHQKVRSGWTSFLAVSFFKKRLKEIVEILLDFENKHLWAPRNKFSKVIKKLKNGNYLVLEHYKAPWPIDNREFLFEGFVKKNSDKEVLIKAWSNTTYPYKNEDAVIAFAKYVDIVVEELAEKMCKVTFSVSGNLGGWLPNWIKSFVRNEWPIQFFEGLRKELQIKRKRNSIVFRELPFSL